MKSSPIMVFVPLLICIVLLVAAGLGFSQVVGYFDIHLSKKPIYAPDGLRLSSIPDSFPGWEKLPGIEEAMSAEVLEELGTTNYLSRWYVETGVADEERRAFQLHTAYYTGTIDTVPHVPERCFTGGGMQIAGETRRDVRVPLDMSRLIVNEGLPEELFDKAIHMARSRVTHTRVNLPEGVEELQMTATPYVGGGPDTIWAGYFFLANEGTVASADDVRLLAFELQDDYAYYCKIQFMSSDVDSAEELGELAGEVLDEIFADIMRCVPDWT
ncbi:MAG: exosortase-associated EpsI family protein, partial [Planctomycetota bacterium]